MPRFCPTRLRALVALAFILLCPPLTLLAQGSTASATKAERPKQFLYILRLVPRLHQESGWTKEDEAAVGRHFRQLKAAVEQGQVILAGKTDEPGAKTMGLVIFEAADEDAARKFMESDPAVMAGVLTAELRPYSVALLRKN